MKILSWNVARRQEPWRVLGEMDVEVALLQEASQPPRDVASRIELDPAPWPKPYARASQHWRTAIAKLSQRVSVEWIEAKSLDAAGDGLAVSHAGTLTAARVSAPGIEPFLVVSMYAPWRRPHAMTGSRWIVSDASAHRVVSDLSALIGRQSGHRILAAGDLNILHGHGEHGSPYWASRYGTVFDRMEALGLPFVGPQAPHGRQADPWPRELPRESRNVPTFHTNRQTPETATRQLDFVFASRELAGSVRARALNEPAEWGPSDHCRLEIEVS
ncbi:MAG: hypothetical protein F4020_03960 [Gammaproteobacteria bacterium]|nr:hypothetical protein [Gammaproteobacteria bacterium]MYK68724.1 hypothetical protein [Gammaproteobacteria bacterium]